jgi:hypothetical protein
LTPFHTNLSSGSRSFFSGWTYHRGNTHTQTRPERVVPRRNRANLLKNRRFPLRDRVFPLGDRFRAKRPGFRAYNRGQISADFGCAWKSIAVSISRGVEPWDWYLNGHPTREYSECDAARVRHARVPREYPESAAAAVCESARDSEDSEGGEVKGGLIRV